jgi:peptide/nickel transport system ATP-binding protein
MSELRFEHVSVRFGSGSRALHAVDGVDLVVPSGKVVGLVGESGSGKSTLARAAMGLTPVTGGRILLDGVPLRHQQRRARRPLQMVFQDPFSSLNPRMTIGRSVAEAVPRGTGSAERRAEVERVLGLVGLEAEYAGLLPGRLSGGQRQRVAVARALAGKPDVVIADEITSALDVSIQGTVLNLIRDLQRQMSLSMLFISHNLAVVRYVSDIVAVMYLGRIVECGPADEVLADPRHPYTRELVAAAPHAGSVLLGDPEVDPLVRAVAAVEPPDPHRPPAGCRFHTRCPSGPVVLQDRSICIERDPASGAENRPHSAACHFAADRVQTVDLIR